MLSSIASRISSRPRRSLAVLLAFVIVAGVLGGPVAGALHGTGAFAPSSSASELAVRQLQRATGAQPTADVELLVRLPQGARTPRGEAVIAAARRRLAAVPGILGAPGRTAIARDGRAALVTGTLRASASSNDVAKAAVGAFAGDRSVVVGGTAVAAEQINSTVTRDLGFAELLAAPLLIVLSIVFFRGRAALMPLAVGVTTVLGTFLVLRGVNELYGLSVFALNLVIGLGLGLAVDYTLFIVTRFREELARGRDVPDAVGETMRHAGATILYSAATVACALATLVLFPEGFLKSMGIAGAIVALVAATVAVTVSPALLGLWGHRLARRSAPAAGVGATPAPAVPSARPPAAADRWYRLARAVMRRPGAVAALTAAAMLAAAAPALSVRWSSSSDRSVVPAGQSARVVADALAGEFAGAGQPPITVAVRASRGAGRALADYAAGIERLPGVVGVAAPRDLGADTWRVDVRAQGDPTGETAQRVVTEIRSLPTALPSEVTGAAAEFVDQQASIGAHLPETMALLAALTFLILWLMTGSFVLPLKAIVMNALTVGAALAALVVVYQHGRLTGLLHYTPDGGVEPTDFVVSATVVFALSTDYGVFLLGRIKEARDALAATNPGRPVDEREAVAAGLGATGRVVTAAAILLAVAIGAFSTSAISFIQQIGVSVGIGVLLDAFVVRSLLVPSLMALLGRLNWWSPRPAVRLRRLLATV